MKKFFGILGIIVLFLLGIYFYIFLKNLYISYNMHHNFEWTYNYRWKISIPDARKTITLMYVDYNSDNHKEYIVKFKYDIEDFKKVSSMVENDYPKRKKYLTITSKNKDFDVLTYINNSYISKVEDDTERKKFLEKVLSLIGDNKKYIVNYSTIEQSDETLYNPLSILIIDEKEQSVYEVYST